MGNKNVIDQISNARELYVQHGVTTYQILADQTGITAKTISRYAREEQWQKLRENMITTPLSIGQRLQSLIVKLMDEMDSRLAKGEIVNDQTLKRLDHISKMLVTLDKNYDDRGMMILSMKRFISYLSRNNHRELIKGLSQVLPDFYRSMSREE